MSRNLGCFDACKRARCKQGGIYEPRSSGALLAAVRVSIPSLSSPAPLPPSFAGSTSTTSTTSTSTSTTISTITNITTVTTITTFITLAIVTAIPTTIAILCQEQRAALEPELSLG
ncbi:hypothetical protein M433DRAFT_151620 [Acidomyces richmondensis BFW]|nr:MAG: hypothetical protein FE78DRAFT_85737 [Acidomyces sp. 'richmondensis']KYG47953.1 hypothetical protein M433DRAFT_151620 [Acidomyces richmondensis BFW]